MDIDDELLTEQNTISRILVANRGEIAVRVFETAREMDIDCVAVFSDADRGGRHVRSADLAVHLPGDTAADTYLNIPAILAAAQRTGADAIHPGYGFLAENPDFAEAVIDAGLTWIGPTPESIRAMALKVQAKNAAAAAGVPLVPGAELTDDLDDAAILARAATVGYPIMIKASAGGGGKGMRIVAVQDELLDAIGAARRESESAFGDPTVFMERYLPRSRHVEVQVFGDGHGNHLHLFDRECSIQRRHQKIIEEAPSPGTTDRTRERMYAAAVNLARRIGYVGAGTVEFLVSGDGDAQEFFFLEMNTRLQVEHRVTEEITGTDLVQWQILVAQGREFTVEQDDLIVQGHAIEVRLYAEDPARDFLPSVGRIDDFTAPIGFGAVVDNSYASGDEVSRFYDPLIAKITTSGADRAAATVAMVDALNETTITGVTTNKDMLVAVLESFPFFAGDTTTAFLDEHPDVLRGSEFRERPALPLLLAATFHHLDTQPDPGAWMSRVFAGNLTADPVPPRFRNVSGTPGFLGLQWGPQGHQQRIWVLFEALRDNRWRIWLADPSAEEQDPDSPNRGPVGPYRAEQELIGEVRISRPGAEDETLTEEFLLIERDGLVTRVAADLDVGGIRVKSADGSMRFEVIGPATESGATVTALGPVAPVPGTVVVVAVEAGDVVAEGQTLVVLEAMKMEHRILAETDGVVRDVKVAPGQSIEAHQVVVELAPAAADRGTPPDGDGSKQDPAAEGSEQPAAGDQDSQSGTGTQGDTDD